MVGLDSVAGAGIEADLKTCVARVVFCSTGITIVAPQNTPGVQDVNILPEEHVVAPLKFELSYMHVDVVC
ncbi:putative transferase [Helianthus annuus]|nr:putative transferase [Helianthus annuus]KAJ0632632.1 putative transferase [Helianthus annuus]KAJ0826553.1 putative transferase [Helianthus annuus]